MPEARVFLDIDVSDVRRKAQALTSGLSHETFQKAMRRTIYETSKQVKTLAKRRIKEQYRMGDSAILKSFASPKISVGAQVSCLIPVKRVRGTIASGSGGSYKALKRGPRAKILVRGNSLLPHSKGAGRVHFYVPSGRLSGRVMVRHEDGKIWKGKRYDKRGRETGTITRRGSISRGVGIAVPQMPMNRSAESIQRDVSEYMLKRLEHNIKVILDNITG